MSGKANAVATPTTGASDQTTNATEQASNAVGYQNIIKKLIASGCKRVNSVRVKNVNFTQKDNYNMVSFTLASPVRGYVTKDEGNSYEIGLTTTIFTSLFAIVGAIKEDENLGWMGNALLENPQALNLILNGSSIDVLQQEVAAGEEYFNPFSTKEDADSRVYDHNIIINNVVSFKLGESGKAMANRLADKLMGF